MARSNEDIPADLAALIRLGTVIEIDPAQALCRVLYGDPDDEEPAETGWIRWLAGRAGETRTWSPPSEGEQVLLLCPDGQLGAAVALPGIVQDDFPPPGSDLTEVIEWSDGARISYDPEESELRAELPAGATVTVIAPGGVTVTAEEGITLQGDVTIEGDVTIDGEVSVSGAIEAQGDVTGEGVSLANHTHSGVASGSASSGPPN